MTCKHDWQPLYDKPDDVKFLNIYQARNLDSWMQCMNCKYLGRLRPNNKVQPQPMGKREKRLIDVAKWNEALVTWQQSISSTR